MAFVQNEWYVVALKRELDEGLLARTVLGQSVVLFRRSDGQPVALRNRCPHKGFPLSEGMLKGDVLACGYHGFRFDTSGTCLSVPGQVAIPTRANVRSYPLVENGPFVWIWPGDPAEADPGRIPGETGFADERFTFVSGLAPIAANHSLIADNVMDLSHESFIHVTKIGSRARRCGHQRQDQRISRSGRRDGVRGRRRDPDRTDGTGGSDQDGQLRADPGGGLPRGSHPGPRRPQPARRVPLAVLGWRRPQSGRRPSGAHCREAGRPDAGDPGADPAAAPDQTAHGRPAGDAGAGRACADETGLAVASRSPPAASTVHPEDGAIRTIRQERDAARGLTVQSCGRLAL
jgi:nitrite reductase/ring-hydroxylating ferredoxin subunit